MEEAISFEEKKKRFPDEWVIIGNPVMDDSQLHVISGIPVFHSKDKREVAYLGRDKARKYDMITLVFTRTTVPKPRRVLTGIFNRVVR